MSKRSWRNLGWRRGIEGERGERNAGGWKGKRLPDHLMVVFGWKLILLPEENRDPQARKSKANRIPSKRYGGIEACFGRVAGSESPFNSRRDELSEVEP